jgi:hypothetical protein
MPQQQTYLPTLEMSNARSFYKTAAQGDEKEYGIS